MQRVGSGIRWRITLWSGLALAAHGAMAAPQSATAPAHAGTIAAPTLSIVDAPQASLSLEFPWRAWRVFSVNDSLPDNLVYAIAQDSAGRVYAGLGDGLARYQGANWQRVPLPGVAGVHAVGALLTQADGSLWIGDDGDGVFRLHDGRIDAIPGLEGPGKVVYRFVDAGENTIWVATDGGLAHCTASGCTQFAPLRGRAVRNVSRGSGPNGPCLWVGMGNEGLQRFDIGPDGIPHDSGFRFARAQGLPNDSAGDVVQWGGKDGHDLWIASGRGLVHYDGQRVVRYTAAIGFTGSVQALQLGRGRDRGLLFAALRPGGLAVIREDGSWGLVGQAQGLPDRAVQALGYTDIGSGTPLLWVGTVAGGLARADPERWQLLDERRDVPARGMTGLGMVRFPDGMQTLWMGSASGTLRLTPSGWRPVPGLPAGTIAEEMAATSDGSFWVAGQDSLWRLRGNERQQFTVDNSQLPAVFVRLLAVESGASGDTLWIGSNHGLGRWTAAEGLRRIDDPPLLPVRASIDALTMAAMGSDPPSLWIGTDERLLRRRGEHWESVAAMCLRDASVTTLVAHQGAQGGEIWVGTDGPLVRVRANGCERRDGIFPAGGIAQIAFDRDGRAWLFGSGGVARLDAGNAASLAAMPMMRYGREDGLQARDFLRDRGVARDAQGRIWVASAAALQVFDPIAEATPHRAPRIVWETAAAGQRKNLLVAGAELPADASPLAFAARLLAFGREERIQYRVQLRGLHREPQPWTADNRFEFNRLGAGRYEALLWGRDADGTVAGPLRLPFRVLAPWWQRTWALALDALLLIACGLLIGRWRHRALRARARELAGEVAVRTRELADANQRLEAMARTDTLTGLHNRRHALDALPELVRRDDRRRHVDASARLLLVLIDIDHFKRINDTHGHAEGDRMLQEVAARLGHGVRGDDMLVRWGGEEFLIAFDGCAPDHAPARLLALLSTVSDAPLCAEGVRLGISVSAGAAIYASSATTDASATATAIEQAIARADAALYEAKRRGRDRAVLADDAGADSARWPQYVRVCAAGETGPD